MKIMTLGGISFVEGGQAQVVASWSGSRGQVGGGLVGLGKGGVLVACQELEAEEVDQKACYRNVSFSPHMRQ
jgi:hypothetical protein